METEGLLSFLKHATNEPNSEPALIQSYHVQKFISTVHPILYLGDFLPSIFQTVLK
jgi:hypothetical protein